LPVLFIYFWCTKNVKKTQIKKIHEKNYFSPRLCLYGNIVPLELIFFPFLGDNTILWEGWTFWRALFIPSSGEVIDQQPGTDIYSFGPVIIISHITLKMETARSLKYWQSRPPYIYNCLMLTSDTKVLMLNCQEFMSVYLLFVSVYLASAYHISDFGWAHNGTAKQ
jgi:hypothetical protein